MSTAANLNISPEHLALMNRIYNEAYSTDVNKLSDRELLDLVTLRYYLSGYTDLLTYFGLDEPKKLNINQFSKRLGKEKVAELSSINVWEAVENGSDIESIAQKLDMVQSVEERFKDLKAALIALAGIYSDEACALAILPPSLKDQYLELVQPRDYAALSDNEVISLGKLCFGVLDSLSVYDDLGVYVETLLICDTAEAICRQLIERSNSKDCHQREKMRNLALNIGHAPKGLKENDIKRDWVLGLESLIDLIVNEVTKDRDFDNLQDNELVAITKLICTAYKNKAQLNLSDDTMDEVLEKCFTSLWIRICEGNSNPITLFPAIKEVYECHPRGLGAGVPILDFEKSLIEALLSLPQKDAMLNLVTMEIATSTPLCNTVGNYPYLNFANTPGIREYRKHISLWADEIIEKGYWSSICLEEAFRRIKLFENDTIRDVKDIDYCRVIRDAFNHYSKQVFELKDDGSLDMKQCSFMSIDQMSDCYFNLWNSKVTDIMPAHFIRYCANGLADDTLPKDNWWTLANISLQAYLKQRDLLNAKDTCHSDNYLWN